MSPRGNVNRRSLLQLAGAAAVAGAAAPLCAAEGEAAESGPAVKHGKIRQSVMAWCFKPMTPVELARHVKALGMPAIEGLSPEFYPQVRELGLTVSLVGSHGFKRGVCDPAEHGYCVEKLKQSIDLAADAGYPNVITFTGMRVKGLTDAQMTKNCIEGWKKVIGYAEEKQVTLCFEHLNSRDDTHPMKGHPGYFGDDVDHCIDMIKAVGSPRMKLLFDIYHVQIMNGDVIRRIRQYKDLIGHYHTAGVPGRGELDDTQELNYPPIMRAILDTGYTGYVAQEFIPTWEDKLASLRHGVRVCDV